MKYRIEECVVCGVLHPTLVLRGWVENTINKIVIKDNANFYYEEELKKVRKRISNFDLNVPLSKAKVFTIYGMDSNGKLETMEVVHSNIAERVKQKYQPQHEAVEANLDVEMPDLSGTWDMKNIEDYNKWIAKYETFSEVQEYTYNPLISIVMPVYNVAGEYLGYCIDSILNQTYQNFEICIADDCSTNQDTIDTLKKYMELDSRVKVVFREQNGHISEATNSALGLVTGEFVGLMDNDDKLVKHALNEVVRVLNENREIDFIYTDEDKIDMEGERSDPHFKSDFALDSLYGGNYICHFSVIRKTLIDKIGGFRKGYEGAQDFDLFLRLSNETKSIYHIPKILYHWRMIPGSTALNSDSKNYAGEAGKRALEDYFKKKNKHVNIEVLVNTHYFVEYILEDEPEVEVIIILEKNPKYLAPCLESVIYNKFNVENDITIVVKEGVNVPDVSDFSGEANITIVKASEGELVTSINQRVREVNKKYLVFLDPATKVDTFDWSEIMAGYASQAELAMIGCKVLDNASVLRRSGVIFNPDSIVFDANIPTYRNDYGAWGRLLVPYNYGAVNTNCCMMEKSKFMELGGLNETITYMWALYDLQLRAVDAGLRNVFLPQVEVVSEQLKKIEIKDSDIQYFKNTWSKYTNSDPYYNVNLSNRNVYRLDK